MSVVRRSLDIKKITYRYTDVSTTFIQLDASKTCFEKYSSV